jgi:FlaA1/EpsC-like NDP-sugar epimerase
LGPDKNRLDQLYVRHRSFLLDLDVLLWTALIMIPLIGKRAIPERLLFIGPFTRLIQRYISWFTVDFFVTFTAIAFSGVVFRLYGTFLAGWLLDIFLAFGFALLFSLSSAILGVNRIDWSRANYADALDLLPPWITATVIAYLVNLVWHVFPKGVVILASVLALEGFILTRYRGRLLTGAISQLIRHWGKADCTRERVLIVGTGTTAQLAAWLFGHTMNSGKFWTVGFVDNDFFNHGWRLYGSR